MMTKGIQSWY